MTTFPGSPRLVKGALVTIDPDTAKQSVIEFQYNPDTLTRRLEARAMGGEGSDRTEVYRLKGPPSETITLNIEIDATDKLEEGDTVTTNEGIYPILSALELLVYPTSASVIENAARIRKGDIEIIPPEAPLTVFVWGEKRVLPVRLSSLSITEEAYDPNLNPIHAKVDLTLQVLTYIDFKQEHRGYKLFMTHQKDKEARAAEYLAGKANSLGKSIKI